MIKEAHLISPLGKILRSNSSGQSFELSEEGPVGSGPTLILDIIDWLNVEKSPRYQPKPSTTYCNIYAKDLTKAANVYLPHVWWYSNVIKQIEAGQDIKEEYGHNIFELNANALYIWLEEWGTRFRWQKVLTLDEAQNAANDGYVVVISGRRTNGLASGHISCVVSETEKCVAIRKDGKVVLPVQSQAGGKNFNLSNGHAWWEGSEFAAYGIWKCKPKENTISETKSSEEVIPTAKPTEIPIEIKEVPKDVIIPNESQNVLDLIFNFISNFFSKK